MITGVMRCRGGKFKMKSLKDEDGWTKYSDNMYPNWVPVVIAIAGVVCTVVAIYFIL